MNRCSAASFGIITTRQCQVPRLHHMSLLGGERFDFRMELATSVTMVVALLRYIVLMTESPYHEAEGAGRFLNAMEEIKQSLCNRYEREFKGVGEAIRYAEGKRHPIVKQNAAALHLLTDLRNTIQHGKVNQGRPIATPRSDAIDAAERIAAMLVRQPPICEYMIRGAAILAPSDTLEVASTWIVDQELSQLPVYDGCDYIGLFTTNALARWVAASIREGDGDIVQEQPVVKTIIDAAEEHEYAKFVKPTASALKCCDTLMAPSGPLALLVTSDGTERGELQGIVTRFDVNRIQQKATVSYP